MLLLTAPHVHLSKHQSQFWHGYLQFFFNFGLVSVGRETLTVNTVQRFSVGKTSTVFLFCQVSKVWKNFLGRSATLIREPVPRSLEV